MRATWPAGLTNPATSRATCAPASPGRSRARYQSSSGSASRRAATVPRAAARSAAAAVAVALAVAAAAGVLPGAAIPARAVDSRPRASVAARPGRVRRHPGVALPRPSSHLPPSARLASAAGWARATSMAPDARRATLPAIDRSCRDGWRSGEAPLPVGAIRLRTVSTPSVAAMAAVARAITARPVGEVRSRPGALT